MFVSPRPLALLFAPFALVAGLTGGCDRGETAADLVDRQLAGRNDIADVICDCAKEYGFESRGECLEESGETLPAQRRCIQDAYARDEGASKTYLECTIPLVEELTACLDNRLTCDEDDGEAYDACLEDYELGAERCIELPLSIGRALEDC